MLKRYGANLSDAPTAHVLFVVLGNGWWNCGKLPGTGLPRCSVNPPLLIMQFHVYGNPVVLSDAPWQVSVNSNRFNIIPSTIVNAGPYDSPIAAHTDGWKLP
jgi:hypothetical protein